MALTSRMKWGVGFLCVILLYANGAYIAFAEPPIQGARLVSSMPIPDGRFIISAQSAALFDFTSHTLHAWYGACTSAWNDSSDVIFYTNTTDFMNWQPPVSVIELAYPIGIRDPTILVDSGRVYLYCQVFNGTNGMFDQIRLYRTNLTSRFASPLSYTYIGQVITLGGVGAFDENMTASFCIVKNGTVYYGAYEARASNSTHSIGLTNTTNIETLPYNKTGVLMYANGTAILNPTGATHPIVPCSYMNMTQLIVHLENGTKWNLGAVNGAVNGTAFTLNYSGFTPSDDYPSHATYATVGNVDGGFVFLSMGWDATFNGLGHLYVYPPSYYVSWAVTPSGAGTVNLANGWVLANTTVSARGTPAIGFAFEGWYSGGVYMGGNNPIDIYIDNNGTVTASFSNSTIPFQSNLDTLVSPSFIFFALMILAAACIVCYLFRGFGGWLIFSGGFIMIASVYTLTYQDIFGTSITSASPQTMIVMEGLFIIGVAIAIVGIISVIGKQH